jgi:hypothetical protein
MEVYLVPLAPNRFECYFEAGDDEAPEPEGDGRGLVARLRARLSRQLREAEQARHEDAAEKSAGVMARLQRRAMAWIAERVAEQRLLWHLGRASRATLHAPDTLATEEADRVLRGILQRDADRHLRRLVVHAVGLMLSLPVMLVPGPNVLGYLFTFTVTGHFLSLRGARRGLSRVAWSITPSAELTALGRTWTLDRATRHREIRQVAGALGLRRLTRFVERMTAPTQPRQ